MQVVDGGLLRCQGRQLVEVSGEQTEAADFGGDVFAYGPGQTKAVVRGRASSELVDYDERVLCCRAEGAKTCNEKNALCIIFKLLAICVFVVTAGWQPSPASQT